LESSLKNTIAGVTGFKFNPLIPFSGPTPGYFLKQGFSLYIKPYLTKPTVSCNKKSKKE